MESQIFYENNLGFIKLPNCKPRQVYIDEIGKYYLKRNNRTKKLESVYLKTS